MSFMSSFSVSSVSRSSGHRQWNQGGTPPLSEEACLAPDGSRQTVWLPDGNVKYFQGKHVASSCSHCPVDCSNWCPLHNSFLSLAMACSCYRVEDFQVDKKH